MAFAIQLSERVREMEIDPALMLSFRTPAVPVFAVR
jgi:hypothetical protein